MSVPFICQTETTQHPAASPSIAVSAAAAVVLVGVMACAEIIGAPGLQSRPLGDGTPARPR